MPFRCELIQHGNSIRFVPTWIYETSVGSWWDQWDCRRFIPKSHRHSLSGAQLNMPAMRMFFSWNVSQLKWKRFLCSLARMAQQKRKTWDNTGWSFPLGYMFSTRKKPLLLRRASEHLHGSARCGRPQWLTHVAKITEFHHASRSRALNTCWLN